MNKGNLASILSRQDIKVAEKGVSLDLARLHETREGVLGGHPPTHTGSNTTCNY